jgi:hypothetical protein
MQLVPLHAPLRAAPAARTDIRLLDAPTADIHLRQHPAVPVMAARLQGDFAGRNKRLKSALRCASAGLVHFRGVNVREPDFLAIANQRIAIDRQATLARLRAPWPGKKEQ